MRRRSASARSSIVLMTARLASGARLVHQHPADVRRSALPKQKRQPPDVAREVERSVPCGCINTRPPGSGGTLRETLRLDTLNFCGGNFEQRSPRVGVRASGQK